MRRDEEGSEGWRRRENGRKRHSKGRREGREEKKRCVENFKN